MNGKKEQSFNTIKTHRTKQNIKAEIVEIIKSELNKNYR